MSDTKTTLMGALRTTTAVLALTFAGGAISTAAHAQGATQPAQPPAQAQQQDISEGQLEKFAVANQKVVKLQQQYKGQASQVESKQQMQALVSQTNEKIKKAIQSSGLTVNEFNVIASALQQDQQLREQFMTMIN